MTFEIRTYPEALWDEDSETWELGPAGELLNTIDAEYPAAAYAAVAHRAHGAYLPTLEAVAAWRENGTVVALKRG